MKKTLIVGAAIAASTLGTVGLAGATFAATGTATKSHAAIVYRVGSGRAHAKLDQAVRDGVITDAQKTAFETEAKTLRAERKSAVNKDSTKQQRQAERAKLKSELKAWATTNNFPLAKVFPKLAE